MITKYIIYCSFVAFLLLILNSCYTTTSHPTVALEDEYGDSVLAENYNFSRCEDCHNEENYSQFDKTYISDNDFYNNNSGITEFYNSVPWWYDYSLSVNLGSDNNESQVIVNVINPIIIETVPFPHPPPIHITPDPIRPVKPKPVVNETELVKSGKRSSGTIKLRNADGGRSSNHRRR